MKTIIVAFFFGVVTYAYTPKPNPVVNQCRVETPASNFQSSKFFTGTWSVTRAKDISTSVCHKFGAQLAGNTITVTADGYYEIGKKREFYNVPCTGTDNKSGKFTLTCQPKKPDSTTKSTITVQVEVTVLETDYTKYALIYRCATSGSVKTENYLVLQRNEDFEMSGLDRILKSKGLEPDKFITKKKSTYVCGNMPSA
uniref:Salivary lipocalin n=1 Tax=Triatoma infestans TaxID=30076 RepID=A6YPM4_TRIIF|nr:salivary lipocalin [Triatoma infestans]